MQSLNKKPFFKTYWHELLGAFFGILVVSLVILFSFNLVPAELEFGPFGKPQDSTEASTSADQKQISILPKHILIPKINVDVSISNPVSDNVETLDEYLKEGAVHYPGSGALNYGNMFLFAHSTGIKVVHNQAYKAFNNLKSLVKDDEIFVDGEDGKTYVYHVTSVKLATAQDVLVSFDNKTHMVTLSTCNTFGQKDERYVVEAQYYGLK